MVAISCVSANSVRPTAIVVGKTSAVSTVNVLYSVAQNVIQILTVVGRNIAAIGNTIAMFADEIGLGKHACQVLTSEPQMNIVHKVINVQIIGTVSKPVIAKMIEHVVNMANVLLPTAQRNAFQM